MSETIKGIGVSLSVGLTDEALAVTVSSVTSAAPPVATTSAAHGLASGDVGYWAGVSGMHELEGQACIVHAASADTFAMPGLDSARWRVFASGTFRRVTQWAVLSETIAYTFGQQRPAQVRATRAFDRRERVLWGLGGNEIATINVRSRAAVDTVRALINAAAARRAALTWRIRLADGRQRVWRGVPSPFSESLSSGQLGDGSFQVLVDGDVLISHATNAITPPPIPGPSAAPTPPPPSGTNYLTDGAGNLLTDDAGNRLTWTWT